MYGGSGGDVSVFLYKFSNVVFLWLVENILLTVRVLLMLLVYFLVVNGVKPAVYKML